MAGYNGLGVSRKEIVQESGSSLAVYELAVGDIYDGYAFDMREELLNHMILVKSTISNNMVSVFIPKTMGEDDDVIRFKLIDDLHDAGGDTPYIDFWGEDWAEDINVSDLQINNVDEGDGFYWIAESQNEAFFKKVNGEWKVIRDKGVFDLSEFKNPRFGELNVRNLIADNYLSINVKDTHVANFNWDKLMLDTLVQFKGHLYSIYQDFQPEKTDLGLIDRPFGDLFLKGNAISAEPTANNHLATKLYVDNNKGIAKLEDDLLPKLGGTLDVDSKLVNNVSGIYGDGHAYNFLKLNGTSYVNLGGKSGSAIMANNAIILLARTNKVQFYYFLEPNANETLDIGSATYRFKKLFAKEIDLSGGLKLGDVLDCNYKKLVNVQNPSSSLDGVNKAYVDAFKINANTTDLGGGTTYTLLSGDFNTCLVVVNTLASNIDITIAPAMGNFIDIFNSTDFDVTIISSNGKIFKSLNDHVKIPKNGKATLKSAGGYYMLYGDLIA